MGGIEVAQLVKDQLAQLTGLTPDTVAGVAKDSEGWHVIVDMVEVRRIPSSTDVLGTYEALMDDAGMLVAYKRTRRYSRSEASQAS